MVDCYFLQEKNEDGDALIHGALDILDEFAETFGKNADKNINIIFLKVVLIIKKKIGKTVNKVFVHKG